MVTTRDNAARRVRIEDYFRSLSREFDAMKDRVRYLFYDGHWQTDGEWKESVLRSVLSRTIPRNMVIGRGFIVGNREPSSQIDILIYDSSYPVLYKDGDLVFITPSSCRAIIEVKTRVTQRSFEQAVLKLADNAEIARANGAGRTSVFTGLFIYEDSQLPGMLEVLQETAGNRSRRIVDHVSVGASTFVKFWARDPTREASSYKQWHEYSLNAMAQGYFAHNLATELAPDRTSIYEQIWFPEDGKEPHLIRQSEFLGRLPPARPFPSIARYRP